MTLVVVWNAANPVKTMRPGDNLREFALCYERHPESVRTVPWLCPAGCDSAPATAGCVFQIRRIPYLSEFSDLRQHRVKCRK